ncbi:hypothetical protein DVM85_03545 [Escherichia coli]|nr:hypothetical protein [Escherichia coli]
MVRYQACQGIFRGFQKELNAMLTPIVMQYAVFRGKQIPLAANITTCARNATMNMCGNLKPPIIPVNATGAANTPRF